MDYKEKLLREICKKPQTFSEIVRTVTCSNETADKYLDELVLNGLIFEKKQKFRIFYTDKVSNKALDLYELMLNPTIKSIILLLLRITSISQPELTEILKKSNPTISKSLRMLFERGLIDKQYQGPFTTYSFKNKNEIISMLNEIQPSLANRMVDGLIKEFTI